MFWPGFFMQLAPIRNPEQPNVVIILADDVGYGDLSCYGATKVKTPNIDELAQTGSKFTDAHSPATVCTPTRYSLLTGEYSFRHQPGAGILSGVAPLSIPTDKSTLPKVFKKHGYTTGIVGKWHLGLGETETDYNKPITAGPKEVGFDYSFVLPATGDRVPCVYLENGRVVNYDSGDPIQVSYKQKVGTDPTGKENPELLKVTPIVGHNGTIVNGVSRIGFMSGGNSARWIDEDMADTFVNRATDFITKNKSKPFFLYIPTHDIHAPLLPNSRFDKTSDCGLRGDTLREFDWTVGAITLALESNGIRKNTIIIVTSDNGGVPNDGYADPRENLNGHKVNGELRGEKYSLWEGGHRVPFIFNWPAKSTKPKTSDALICHVDLYSTLSKLIGNRILPSEAPDSLDMGSAIINGSKRGRKSLVSHLGGFNSPLSYREGDFVIVPNGQKWELYDLKKDLRQTTNLADKHPETVTKMMKALEVAKLPGGTRPGFKAQR